MELAPDFDEFFGSLLAHHVEFLVVGAYALAFHGAPRFTGDIDVLVRPDTTNGVRLLDALRAFGFPTGDLRAEDLTNPDRILQLGVEPVQIHVMSAISGVTWEEAWAGRQMGRCGSHELPFTVAATSSGISGRRLKDLADIEALGENRTVVLADRGNPPHSL